MGLRDIVSNFKLNLEGLVLRKLNYDTLWRYKYYLRRNPENDDVLMRVSSSSKFMTSKELESATFVGPHRHQDFCIYRDGAPKVVILSSCQGPHMAKLLAAMAHVSVYAQELKSIYSSDSNKHYFQMMMESADLIISAPLTNKWGVFEKDVLKAKYKDKIFFYNRPFFEAIHPDCFYPRFVGGSSASPVGDYHSRLVLSSYAKKLSPEDCVQSFNINTFVDMGYDKIQKDSFAKLLEKDKDVDLKIHDFVLENYQESPLFYTINHPTHIFNAYICKMIIKKLGVALVTDDTYLTHSSLLNNTVWPVHDFWADHLSLKYRNNMFGRAGYTLDLEFFVRRSYANYARLPESCFANYA